MYWYDRQNSTNRSTGDTLTSTRMNDFNKDLDALFERLDDRNLSLTYDAQNRLTVIVDNTNSVTITIDRTDFALWLLYIQETWDPSKFTVTYSWNTPSTIIYS